MAQWRTSRGGQYDRDRVRNRPALHERHGRSRARFVRAIPDSCGNFPIGARHSRFVLEFPDSCARLPIEVVGRLPSGAIRSTHWGESLHPPTSPGANRSSVWSNFPDSCSNFPIGAFGGLARDVRVHCGMSRAARSVARSHKGYEGDRARAAAPYPSARFFVCFPTHCRSH